MRRLLTLGLAASLLLLAACGGTNPAPTPSPSTTQSGVRGIVLQVGGPPYFSELSPSPLPGGFGTTEQGRPYRWVTVEVAKDTARGEVVARVKPDADALFTVNLPPGTYVLTSLAPGNRPTGPPVKVVVKLGHYTRAFLYDHVR